MADAVGSNVSTFLLLVIRFQRSPPSLTHFETSKFSIDKFTALPYLARRYPQADPGRTCKRRDTTHLDLRIFRDARVLAKRPIQNANNENTTSLPHTTIWFDVASPNQMEFK